MSASSAVAAFAALLQVPRVRPHPHLVHGLNALAAHVLVSGFRALPAVDDPRGGKLGLVVRACW